MNRVVEIEREILHGHLFCGIGGGAVGFNRGSARVGSTMAKFVCVGGIDVDPASCRDFARNVGVPASCLDLFTLEQYVAFHGKAPPAGWREAVPDDVRIAFGNRKPHIVFLSAPCKGNSGLLSETASKLEKYQALNALGLRGVWLLLEAYKDDPVEMIIFENVPRIATRSRSLLDRIMALLDAYGYAAAETTHDCGEIGNLAQSRKRFLLVARHREKVPPFLYEPEKHKLRGVGEVLDLLPVPLSGLGGPMHRMPALQWKTWVRLAFVRAGGDWRSLNDLAVENGVLRDFGIVPAAAYHNGAYGVKAWGDSAGTVTANGRPASGPFSVADPRELHTHDFHGLRVNAWLQSAAAVTTQRSPGSSAQSVADVRYAWRDAHENKMAVRSWEGPAKPITGSDRVGSGAQSVADPRVDGHPKSVQLGVREWKKPAGVVTGKMFAGGGPNSVADPRLEGKPFNHVFRIVRYDDPAPAIGGPGGPGGGLAVADPLPEFVRGGRTEYLTGGHYGVVAYDEVGRAVTGTGQHDNGFNSVAHPRPCDENSSTARASENNGLEVERKSPDETVENLSTLPAPNQRLVCVIRAIDGTWHRPFTTLELAALQGLISEDELVLDGLSDASWRERIGNMVPPPAAQAIANLMGETLLLAWSGVTFTLSAAPIWVRNVAVALSVKEQEIAS